MSNSYVLFFTGAEKTDQDLTDFSSFSTMALNGWTIDVAGQNQGDRFACNLPTPSSVYGYNLGPAIGSIHATFKGSGSATLTYGNGYPSGNVTVKLNGAVVDTATGYMASPHHCKSPCNKAADAAGTTHDGTKSVTFTFSAGDVIRVEEDFAMFCLHSLTLSLPGITTSS